MSSSKKELEQKQLIRKTINSMNKQIDKLEEQKSVYVEAGKTAKEKGLQAQYDLALSGLRMTITQQRRVYEMKLNFEITSQLNDMSKMTSEFLDGMGSLSKEMGKLTNDKSFTKVSKQFNDAMNGVELQGERMEEFLEETRSAFDSGFTMSKSDNAELEALIDNEAAAGSTTEDMIEKELEELKRKMG